MKLSWRRAGAAVTVVVGLSLGLWPASHPAPLTLGAARAVAGACSDGVDNDHDGFTDTADPGCKSAADESEINKNGPQCDNGRDDDGDGKVDFGGGPAHPARHADPDCTGPADTDESSGAPPAGTLNCTTPTTDPEYPSGDTADDSNKQYDFGMLVLGTPPQSVTVTCAVGGPSGAVVVIGGAALTGGDADFTTANDHCSASAFSAGNSCTVDVVFTTTASAPGPADGHKATLVVTHDGTNGPQDSTLYEATDGGDIIH